MKSKKSHSPSLEELVIARLQRLSPPYNEWAPRALRNHQHGFVNDELLAVLTDMTYWTAEAERKKTYERTKRAFDLVVAVALVLMISPLLIACAIAIKIDSKGPVFFRQLRGGRFAKPFWILKFRTLPMIQGENIHFLKPLEKPKRNSATKVGKFLREHKLDELPQLWNVFKGDMSIVGPRPFSMNDTATILTKHYIRFAIKPGLTGLWQATLPNDINGKVKFAFDGRYVMRRCWSLDLYLLANTIPIVLMGETRFSRKVRRGPNRSALMKRSRPDDSSKAANF